MDGVFLRAYIIVPRLQLHAHVFGVGGIILSPYFSHHHMLLNPPVFCVAGIPDVVCGLWVLIVTFKLYDRGELRAALLPEVLIILWIDLCPNSLYSGWKERIPHVMGEDI